jgi:hypothetical protein
MERNECLSGGGQQFHQYQQNDKLLCSNYGIRKNTRHTSYEVGNLPGHVQNCGGFKLLITGSPTVTYVHVSL